MSRQLNVAVIGASGAVGEVFLRVAAERKFPIGRLKLLATKRSAGKQMEYAGSNYTVEETSLDALKGADLVFCSATSEASKFWGPQVVQTGAVMIDDGAAYRMQENVPLVVPEVNGEDVDWHEGILSIPNCTTTPLAMALHALRAAGTISRVTASTYQAVSGTGAQAVAELRSQLGAFGRGEALPAPQVYPHQIAMNVIPQVDSFGEDMYTGEELKMRNETRKILHDLALPFAATCVRVPTIIGHAESVHVQFDGPVAVGDARAALAKMPGLAVMDDPTNSVYPTPLNTEGDDRAFVGRLRRDQSVEHGLVFWVVSDNLRKGAATNAIQIAEEMLRRGKL
ncbi:MAG: aspartate-semialdehyde dehydrogenase [Dehalococcoidia bacterium]|nr:aspartate-semialdehyde dehydrogenase [Dehalococcoidia bacterium]